MEWIRRSIARLVGIGLPDHDMTRVFEIRAVNGHTNVLATSFIPRDTLLMRDALPLPAQQQRHDWNSILSERVYGDILTVQRMQSLRTAIYSATGDNIGHTGEIITMTMRILHINGRPLDHIQAHLHSLATFFPVAAQINHSCVPNADYVWHEGSLEILVFANRDIAPGEEITASRLSKEECLRPRAERQQLLGFHCHCPACDDRYPKNAEYEENIGHVRRVWRDHGLDERGGIDTDRLFDMGLEELGAASQQAQLRVGMAELRGYHFVRYWALQGYTDAAYIALNQWRKARHIAAGRAAMTALDLAIKKQGKFLAEGSTELWVWRRLLEESRKSPSLQPAKEEDK